MDIYCIVVANKVMPQSVMNTIFTPGWNIDHNEVENTKALAVMLHMEHDKSVG